MGINVNVEWKVSRKEGLEMRCSEEAQEILRGCSGAAQRMLRRCTGVAQGDAEEVLRGCSGGSEDDALRLLGRMFRGVQTRC